MLFRASRKHQTPFLPTTLGWISTLCSQTIIISSLTANAHHRDSPHLPTSDPATCKMVLGGLHSIARQSQRSFASSSLFAQKHQCLSKTQRSVSLPLLTAGFRAVRCSELHCSCCLLISRLLRHVSEIQYAEVTVYVTCYSVYPPNPSSWHRAWSASSWYSA